MTATVGLVSVVAAPVTVILDNASVRQSNKIIHLNDFIHLNLHIDSIKVYPQFFAHNPPSEIWRMRCGSSGRIIFSIVRSPEVSLCRRSF